ncbi:MAG TPA: phage holin family protein [Mycobacteriales bacterium]|jgi:uncharacterized membrane protein YqjE|nr:phage holin family protein [Mycobacteriales bacterium]
MSISVSPQSDGRPAEPAGRSAEPSLGDLVGTATRELSTLVRKEVELAKVELKGELANAGKGAGMFGAAGVLVFFAAIFLSTAIALGLVEAGLEPWAAALIVGVVYLAVAGLLGLLGKKSFASIRPPERTIGTLKEDVAWARSRRS